MAAMQIRTAPDPATLPLPPRYMTRRRSAPTVAFNAEVESNRTSQVAPEIAGDDVLRDGPDLDEYTGRRDALPEHYAYRDEGCDLNPTCLSCPLERCRYDDFRGVTTLRISERQPAHRVSVVERELAL